MYLHKVRASKDFQICNVVSLMVAVRTCVLLNPEHKVLTSLIKVLSQRETWISMHDSDISWLSLTHDLFCAQVTCWSSGQCGSSVFQERTSFPLQWIVGSVFMQCDSIWFMSSKIPHHFCSVDYTSFVLKYSSKGFANFNRSVVIQWILGNSVEHRGWNDQLFLEHPASYLW